MTTTTTQFAESVEHLLDMLGVEKHEIGRPGVGRYLTRYVLKGTRYGPGEKLFLHIFHRSDYEGATHNHPFPFCSLILAGGYWEHVPAPCPEAWDGEGCRLDGDKLAATGKAACVRCDGTVTRTVRTWYETGSELARPAEWFHRVEIPEGEKAVTLLWIGGKTQSWGFACEKGFVPWRDYVAREEAGLPGCE